MAGDVGPYKADIHPEDANAQGSVGIVARILSDACVVAVGPSDHGAHLDIANQRVVLSGSSPDAFECARSIDARRTWNDWRVRDFESWTVRVRARIRFPHDVGRRGHRSSGQHGNDNCGISGRPDLFHSQRSLRRIPPRIFGVDVVDILENHVPVAGTGASIGKQRSKFGGAERRGTLLTVVVEFVPDTVMRDELERVAQEIALETDELAALAVAGRLAPVVRRGEPARLQGKGNSAKISEY